MLKCLYRICPIIGIADVHMSPEADTPNGIVGFSDSHTNLAWQGIAGLRYAVSPNIDVGLKYRFFNATNLSPDAQTPSCRWLPVRGMTVGTVDIISPPPLSKHSSYRPCRRGCRR